MSDDDPQVTALRERYLAAKHAMQTGVAFTMDLDPTQTSPKHLRVGVNSALADLGSLGQLLINKGLVSKLELWTALVEGAEREKAAYEAEIAVRRGVHVTLG
jgi:hypothetical protein